MTSLWSSYVQERLGWSVVENDFGFIAYSINGEDASIEEFYVIPEKRGTRVAKELADTAIAEIKECNAIRIWAKVTPSLPGAEKALKTNLHYGFKLAGVLGNDIILKMELGG